MTTDKERKEYFLKQIQADLCLRPYCRIIYFRLRENLKQVRKLLSKEEFISLREEVRNYLYQED